MTAGPDARTLGADASASAADASASAADASALAALLPDPADLLVYEVPLTTRFRGIERRSGVLLPGVEGWAEFSPFWEYDAPTSRPWLVAALEAANLPPVPPRRREVPVNVTVPAVGPEAAARIAVRGGCSTAKIKVAEAGQTLADEVARVAAVRSAMTEALADHPDPARRVPRLRVDANARWTLPEALEHLLALDEAAGGLEYAEQPVATIDEMAALRAALTDAGRHVPLAADELVRRAEDPLAVARAGAADVLVLKVQPLGGVRSCLALQRQTGLPVVVSSALESSVGIAQGLALAAALPELPHACGLSTVDLLARDTAAPAERLAATGGAIAVPEAPPAPDVAALAAWQAPADLRRRWLDRYAEVAALV